MLKIIGGWIKAARKQANMTQGELGRKVGLSTSTISEIEAGDKKYEVPPGKMVIISDAVQDVGLAQNYCDSCPIRSRIIPRKFKPLNNILPDALSSALKVSQKLSEAVESISVMIPKMLKKGFEDDPDYQEFCDEVILKILSAKRGLEILIDKFLERRIVTPERLQLLVDHHQRHCEEQGHHDPTKEL